MAQNQNYAKSSNKALMSGGSGSKSDSQGSLSMIKAGGQSTSGPTGSSKSYPKNSGLKMATNWNPQKLPANTFGINGI